jgi:enterochelin esterase-like enzyme
MGFTGSKTVIRIFLGLLIGFSLAGCASVLQPTEPISLVMASPDLTLTTLEPSATATLSTPPPCTQTQGRLVKASLPASMLKSPLDVTVYLPPCYSEKSTQSYPTLYMLHGMSNTNEQWVRLGLTDTADRLINAGSIQPMLIVLPDELYWQLSPDQSGFGNAITDVLIPWVEKTYHACSERDCRAIGGLSRGGNWAVKIGFENVQLFSAIGAHSTPLFIGGIMELTSTVHKLPSPVDAPAVYVDAGSKDENIMAVREFEKTLTQLHVAHEFHLNTGAHDEAYWSAHVEEYLLWYSTQLRK